MGFERGEAMKSPELKGQVVEIEEPMLARLIATLEEMIKRYQALLFLLQREKQLMVEGNLDDLAGCLLEKERFMGFLRQLEERRLSEMIPLARRFQITLPSSEGQGISLRQLADAVTGSHKTQLLSCHERLRALCASVSEINQINGLLTNRFLRQVNALLGLLIHLSPMPLTYQSQGLSNGEMFSKRLLMSTGSFYTQV